MGDMGLGMREWPLVGVWGCGSGSGNGLGCRGVGVGVLL